MRSEDISATIARFYKVKRPLFITGEPGVGKTSVVEQAAGQLGVPYIHVHAATMLTEDFGMPMLTKDDDKFGYKMPHWWPTNPEAKALLAFDDMGQCDKDIQKVIANIIQQRELHGHRLPDGVMVVATGNRAEDRAGANRILGHLANRYTQLEFEPDLDAWCRWAINHEVSPTVVSFLRFRPNLLQDYDPQRSSNPTCRSWVEGISDIMGLVTPETEFDCYKGAVGEGAAAEFVGFCRIERSLPNIDNLLLHPETTAVPEDAATLYAISGAIAHRATNANFARVVCFANRMPQEFGVLTISYATRKDETLASTQAFTEWAISNQNVLW